jgi:hypothetical protein
MLLVTLLTRDISPFSLIHNVNLRCHLVQGSFICLGGFESELLLDEVGHVWPERTQREKTNPKAQFCLEGQVLVRPFMCQVLAMLGSGWQKTLRKGFVSCFLLPG